MNKLLSSGALALLAAATLTQAHAQSSVTLYGVVDTSLTRADNGNNGLWRLDSGAGWGSRLGFRGTEDLGGGLKANFVLEQGFDVSTGTLQQGGATFGRAAWLGLSGADWEARVGRQLSPMALSLLAVDPGVGNYWGNLQSTGIGSNSPNSVAGDAGHQATARINNSLLGRWTTGALTARLMLAPGESASPKGAGNYHGGSLTYQDSQWVATLGYSRFRQYAKDIPVTANADWQNELTFAASYNFGPVRLASGYYRFDPSEQNKVITATTLLKSESVWVGGTIPVNNGQILLQVIRAKSHRTAGVADGTATILGATYEHFLSKRTVVYVSGGIVKNNDTSNIALVGSTAAVAAAGLGADPKAVSFGIRHSF